jgi:hypothetical protein
VLRALAIMALVVIGFLAGMLTERIRYDHRRDEVLRRFDQAVQEHRARLMESERRTR